MAEIGVKAARGSGHRAEAERIAAESLTALDEVMRFTLACEICHRLPEMLPDGILAARIALKCRYKMLVLLVSPPGFEPGTY
jgi:hypothetical protein